MKKGLIITCIVIAVFLTPMFAQGTTETISFPDPEKTITVVCPQAAGGGTDLIARTLVEEMKKVSGQNIIVTNITGAGTATGTNEVLNNAADGYMEYPPSDAFFPDQRENSPILRTHAPSRFLPKRWIPASWCMKENFILKDSSAQTYNKGIFLNKKIIAQNASRLRKDFDIRSPNTEIAAGTLSGGNIQKVILAREITREPKFLVAVYPIRGLDLGAAQFIHGVGCVEQRHHTVSAHRTGGVPRNGSDHHRRRTITETSCRRLARRLCVPRSHHHQKKRSIPAFLHQRPPHRRGVFHSMPMTPPPMTATFSGTMERRKAVSLVPTEPPSAKPGMGGIAGTDPVATKR